MNRREATERAREAVAAHFATSCEHYIGTIHHDTCNRPKGHDGPHAYTEEPDPWELLRALVTP